MKKNIVVLTGAGISAESGIPTFRGNDGLWEGHDIMEVASPIGWENNPKLVLDFYNERRSYALKCEPNEAHMALTSLEKYYNTHVVTQNVDDLHERANNSKVLHLHGMLNQVRSVADETLVYPWLTDLNMGDVGDDNHQLRPHIVWFGESVPMLFPAVQLFEKADIVLIIGTSLQVYPAASLTNYCSNNTFIYYIDPDPSVPYELNRRSNFRVIASNATKAVPLLVDQLIAEVKL